MNQCNGKMPRNGQRRSTRNIWVTGNVKYKLVPLQKGIKLMGMTTRWEYKITNSVFDKFKILL
jgi:hypothetical protein